MVNNDATPERWEIHSSSDPVEKFANGYGIRINDADGHPVAYAKHYGPLWPETARRSFANAHLIAAAPETKAQRDALLEACKACLDRLETVVRNRGGILGDEYHAIEDARAAIARAEGGAA